LWGRSLATAFEPGVNPRAPEANHLGAINLDRAQSTARNGAAQRDVVKLRVRGGLLNREPGIIDNEMCGGRREGL
jgi:hypothetical protein